MILCGLWFSTSSAAQINKTGFVPPLDIPLELSGNFMELRSDHFHSGLDFKTLGREGVNVKAVGDGWVSRIKISPWGYGKAVYIDHPNGTTSVYGHLKELKGALAKATLDAQYKARDFSIDITPEAGALPVKAGEVFALSGNTGGSTAPHLHFEIRRTSDQHALDPEAYGIDLPDTTPPQLLGLRIEPLEASARVAPYPLKAKGIALQKLDSTYTLKAGTEAKALGAIALSLNAIDKYDNSGNSCGIRSIELWVDGVATFSCHLDEIDFGLQRYCNAYMEYDLFKRNDLNYNRCYRLPNNKLAIYGTEPAQGRIVVASGDQRAVRFRVTDANGNVSILRFTLVGATATEAATWSTPSEQGELFGHRNENTLQRPGLRFGLAPNALYHDERITYTTRPALAKALTPLHVVHDALVPLHIAGELAVEVSKPPARTDKLLLVKIADNGAISAQGGHYANGWVTGKVKGFGTYTVMLDTIAPKITPLDLKADMKGRNTFSLKVADDLSGLDQWSGTLDGEWILLEFEPKSKTLRHSFDDRSSAPGKHTFKLEVSDDRGNRNSYTTTFTR